jgi:hypothetical protein
MDDILMAIVIPLLVGIIVALLVVASMLILSTFALPAGG